MSYPYIIISVLLLFFPCGCGQDDPVSPGNNGPNKEMLTDIDGNEYETVEIGDQWWMAENLRVKSYRNGDAILTGLSNPTWRNTISGAYALYPDTLVDNISSSEAMLLAYGALYNWYAVNDRRGLCPEGWRIPTDEEWKQLELHLGISQQAADRTGWRENNEGGKLKSTRTAPNAHPKWNNPNVDATNETGWTGLPAGYRDYNGDFVNIGVFGRWWTSSEHIPGSGYALFRSLGHNYSGISRFVSLKQHGYSVRCVKEEEGGNQ